ncbi:MAG: antibiotic biosynthesis monooxygenase, partial [Gammaproteobacteria bacterium]|nr:antibiotic biosynthesis monooxygenase [Gammaproteobacteria bacterium]
MSDKQKTVAAFVIRHHVIPGEESTYVAWQQSVTDKVRDFPGFISVSTFKPQEPGEVFTTVLQFEGRDQVEAWVRSETRRAALEQVAKLLAMGEQTEVREGIEYWFTEAESVPVRARQWKQFLITWSAIYPLTVLVPLAFSPVYEALPATRMPVIGN